MGRRATGTVEPLRTTIRLKFTWNGARCVETINLAPTPANIRAAERLMARVQAAIAAGVYQPTDFFDKPASAAPTSFRAYAETWLDTLTLEKSTRRSYRTALNSTWFPAFGDKRLDEIKHSDIRRAVAAKDASGKTVNNHLIPLRAIFDMAVKDDEIKKDPTQGIENLKHQAPEPDPFEADEVDLIMARLRGHTPEPVANYFEFAFLTGMRPSEIIALTWGDIDFRRARARVSKARVDWELKGTKTATIRDVDLSDDALAVLKRQKAETFLGGEEVFNNPNTGKPWADEQVQRRRYWNPTLKVLGMRQRDAYQCRHTYATLLLMGGVNVAYIARQLGHAKITTTLNTYARWIDGADKGAESAKANAILSRNRPRSANGG